MTTKKSYGSKDIASCVNCGSCKALCPTYIENSTELMSARGRVALLNRFSRGEITATSKLCESLFSCILCGACGKSCPLGINVADAVYKGRRSLRSFDKKRLLVNYLINLAFKNPALSFKLLKILKIVSDIPHADRLPPFRHLKKLGISSPNSVFRGGNSVFRAQKPRGRIAIFTGCVVNFIYPSYGEALLNVLNTMGYDVILPPGEVCCGAPMLESGMEDDAVGMAEINIQTFKNLNVEAVIGLCPTCIHFIRTVYPKLTGDCIDNALDITEFFDGKIAISTEADKRFTEQTINPSLKAVYHDPCHSKYSLNISSQPRNILKAAGLNLIEPAETGCCGFGGTFRLFFEELSDGILENRLESYKNADVIITSCPNCILQLKSKIKKRKVIHIIDIISKVMSNEHV